MNRRCQRNVFYVNFDQFNAFFYILFVKKNLLKDSILVRKTLSNKILLTVVYININILNCEFP